MKHIFLLITSLALSSPYLGAQDLSRILPDTIENGFYQTRYGSMQIEGSFKNFKQEGDWHVYFENGQIHILEQYKQGKKDGIYIKISKRGYISEQIMYKSGQINGRKMTFNPGGRLQLAETYKMGILDGDRKVYYENGRIQEESVYKNGKKTAGRFGTTRAPMPLRFTIITMANSRDAKRFFTQTATIKALKATRTTLPRGHIRNFTQTGK